METTTELVNVEEFKSWLTRQKTTKDLFRWNVTTEVAWSMLQSAYRTEVESRGMQCEIPKEVSEYLWSIAVAMTTKSSKCGIILCGNCGNGKTTSMKAFAMVTEYLQGIHRKQCLDMGVWPDKPFKMEKTSARRIVQVAKDEVAMSEAKRATVLCIDDVGLEPTEVLDYGNSINPVIEILEQRYNQQLFTFITTNLTPAQIREKYGDRIADRFNEMMKSIVFKNPSFR